MISHHISNHCFLRTDLASLCQVKGIPSGIVLNAQGLFITNKGREDIQSKRTSCVNDWRQREPLPIAEGISQVNDMSPGGMVWQLFMGLLKNPIYLFGLLYMFKYFTRQYSGGSDGLENGASDGPLSAGDEPISDDEF